MKNKKIEQAFINRMKQHTYYTDTSQTSYTKKIITFRDGYARTEYYVYKKTLEIAGKVFREYPQISEITVVIPSSYENKKYCTPIKLKQFEAHFKLKIETIQGLEQWRNFLNTNMNKKVVTAFGKKFVTSYIKEDDSKKGGLQ